MIKAVAVVVVVVVVVEIMSDLIPRSTSVEPTAFLSATATPAGIRDLFLDQALMVKRVGTNFHKYPPLCFSTITTTTNHRHHHHHDHDHHHYYQKQCQIEWEWEWDQQAQE